MPLAPLVVLVSAALAFPAAASAAWTWPVKGPVMGRFSHDGSRYGAGFHRGIDIQADPGTAVAAATDGLVTFVGRAADSGLTVGLRTADGRFDTSYLHLEAAKVEKGQEVGAGSVIGLAGVSGRPSSAVPHVHFGVRDAGTESAYRDPLELLEGGATPPPAAGPLPPRGPEGAQPHPAQRRPLGRPAPSPDVRPKPARRPAPRAVPGRGPVAQPHAEGRLAPGAGEAPGLSFDPDPVPRDLPGTGGPALHLPARAPLGPGAGPASRRESHAPRRVHASSPNARPGAGGGGPGSARLIGAAAAFVLILILLAGARGRSLSSIARRWATTSQRRSTT